MYFTLIRNRQTSPGRACSFMYYTCIIVNSTYILNSFHDGDYARRKLINVNHRHQWYNIHIIRMCMCG